MKNIPCLLFIIGFPFMINSQPSTDPEFQKIEDSAWEFEKLGQYEKANEIYKGLLKHPSLTCETEGRIYKFIGINQLNLEQKEEALQTFLNDVIPVWENCASLPKRYLVSPYNKVAARYLVLKQPKKSLAYSQKVINLYNAGYGKETEYQLLNEAYNYAASAYAKMGNAYLSNKYTKAAEYINLKKIDPKYQPEYSFKNLQEIIRINLEDEKYETVLETSKKAIAFDVNKDLGYTPTKGNLFILRENKMKALLELNMLDDAKNELEYLSKNISDVTSIDTKTQYYQLAAQYNSKIGNQQQALNFLKIADDLAGQVSDMSNRAINKLFFAEVYHSIGKENLSDEYISKAIGNLTGVDLLNIVSSEIDLKNKAIINYDDLFFILSAYFDMKIALYEHSHEVKYLDEIIAIFDEIDYLIKSTRINYKSEFSQLTQVEKIYGMYGRLISYLVLQDEKKYTVKALEYVINNKSTILSSEIKKNKTGYTFLSDSDRSTLINQDNALRNLEQSYLISKENDKDSFNMLYLEKFTENYMFSQGLKKNEDAATNAILTNISVDDISKELAHGEALLEIYFGEEECFTFLLANGEVAAHKIVLTPSIVQLLTSTANNLVAEGPISEFKGNSQKIYELFFSHLLDKEEVNKIIVVPDGLFHDIPLESLWSGDGYLIQKYDISNLNSAQKILGDSPDSDLSYTGFGTTYTHDLNAQLNKNYSLNNIRLSKLENAETEIKSGKEIFGGKSFLGSSSTLTAFDQNEKKITGILHFALHGLILDEYNSAILFDEREENFMLSSSEVYNMELNNYLSILSACYSADGKIYAGEGVRSLARAFMAAGSRNIISSLWAASDQANAQIMTSFFKGVKNKQTLPHALSEAKRSYITSADPSMQHPSNWANMILVGVGDNEPGGFPLWGIGFILAIIGGYLWYKRLR